MKAKENSKLQSFSESEVKKQPQWSFRKIASTLWSHLAPYLRNVASMSLESSNFNIDRYTVISEYARSCVFVFPLTKQENYCLAYHITERIWYNPPSKAEEHLIACLNRINRVYGWEKKKIRNITINLMGNYTKPVNERKLTVLAKRICKKLGLTTNVRVFVFRDERGLEESAKKVIWFFKQRLNSLKSVLNNKGIKAFGVVKDRMKVFSYLIEGFTLLFLKKLPYQVVVQRMM